MGGRMVAALTRIFGVRNLTLAEDAVQDAFCRAMDVWRFRGVAGEPVRLAEGDREAPGSPAARWSGSFWNGAWLRANPVLRGRSRTADAGAIFGAGAAGHMRSPRA